MTNFCYSLPSKMHQNSFWRPWGFLSLLGGSLGSLLFSVGFGSLFHRFGRCPNQEDFLEEFVFQSVPKLVLVTLAPFGPLWGGDLFVAPWLHTTLFHFGFLVNSAFWHHRFVFSLGISKEFCVLPSQIHVFVKDF